MAAEVKGEVKPPRALFQQRYFSFFTGNNQELTHSPSKAKEGK
jgi:hypothetical protein